MVGVGAGVVVGVLVPLTCCMHLYRLRLGVGLLLTFTCSLFLYHLRVACSFTACVLVLLYRFCVGAGVGVGSIIDVVLVGKPPLTRYKSTRNASAVQEHST